jgi:hypothetical protein
MQIMIACNKERSRNELGGITANVSRLCEGGEIEAQMFKLALKTLFCKTALCFCFIFHLMDKLCQQKHIDDSLVPNCLQ